MQLRPGLAPRRRSALSACPAGYSSLLEQGRRRRYDAGFVEASAGARTAQRLHDPVAAQSTSRRATCTALCAGSTPEPARRARCRAPNPQEALRFTVIRPTDPTDDRYVEPSPSEAWPQAAWERMYSTRTVTNVRRRGPGAHDRSPDRKEIGSWRH